MFMALAGSTDENFKFSSTGYSERAIYGKSTDTRGHYVHKRVNMPPALVNSIAVNLKEWGYPTFESFVRDACVHRLRYWTQNAPSETESASNLSLIIVEELFAAADEAKNTYHSFRNYLQQAQSDAVRKMVVEQIKAYRNNLPSYYEDIGNDLDFLVERYG